MTLSRRAFVLSSASAAVDAAWVLSAKGQQMHEAAPLTVGSVLDRIKQHVGVPWPTPTVDNLLSATSETPIHGVAVTMMATFDVCKRALAQGCNLIVTHETPFYLHQDKTDDISKDAVLKAKQAWLAENDVALFHFHRWHTFQAVNKKTNRSKASDNDQYILNTSF